MLKRLKDDYVFRTVVTAALSFFATVAFTGYNLFLGIAYKTVWNAEIAVYYAMLVLLRAYAFFAERAINRSVVNDVKRKRRISDKIYISQCVILFLTGVALIAPVSHMVLQKKQVNYSTVPAIAMAAYTTFKISVAVYNYFKTRKNYGLFVKMLKNISLADALVSVLVLQYTLVMIFGNGVTGDMFTLCAITTFFIWGFITLHAVAAIVSAFINSRLYRD